MIGWTMLGRETTRVPARSLVACVLSVVSAAVAAAPARAQEVTTVLHDVDTLTEVALPTALAANCYAEGVDRELIDLVMPDDALAERMCLTFTKSDAFPETLIDDIVCNYEEVTNAEEAAEFTCEPVTHTEPWDAVINCREWTAEFSVVAYLPAERDTFDVDFLDNRRTAIHMNNADAEIIIHAAVTGTRLDKPAASPTTRSRRR